MMTTASLENASEPDDPSVLAESVVRIAVDFHRQAIALVARLDRACERAALEDLEERNELTRWRQVATSAEVLAERAVALAVCSIKREFDPSSRTLDPAFEFSLACVELEGVGVVLVRPGNVEDGQPTFEVIYGGTASPGDQLCG